MKKKIKKSQYSEVDSIRWVANNIDSGATKLDCPTPIAWTLLSMCREDSDFKLDFIKNIWVKLLPSKAQLENDEVKLVEDGKVTVGVINRLRKHRDKSIMACKLKSSEFENTFGDYAE